MVLGLQSFIYRPLAENTEYLKWLRVQHQGNKSWTTIGASGTGNNDRIKLYAFDFDAGSNQQKTGGIEINNDRAGSDFSTTGTCVTEVKNALEVTGITGTDNENSYNGNFEEYGSIVVGGRNAITTYNNVTIGVDNTNSAKDSLIVGHDNSVARSE